MKAFRDILVAFLAGCLLFLLSKLVYSAVFSDPEFRYHDKVKVVSGFYEGETGSVLDCYRSGLSYKYILRMGYAEVATVSESQIEKAEENDQPEN